MFLCIVLFVAHGLKKEKSIAQIADMMFTVSMKIMINVIFSFFFLI